jgi:GNAT superfamily N-acetyltransferase
VPERLIRPAAPRDVRFLRDMLHHAYYWRESALDHTDEPPVQRYVANWGRPGDTGLILLDESGPIGAAWYRRFSRDQAGFGFVDEETPELSIAVVPSRRGQGHGAALLEALLDRARREGHRAISLSVERGSPAVHLYEQHGFRTVGQAAGAYTMVAPLGADPDG